MTRPTKILPVSAIAAALVLAATGARAQTEKPAPLSDGVRAAIEEALLDELRGEAIYARVLKDHGDVRPFSNVVRAERRHAEFLEHLLKVRGLAVPAPPAGAEVPGSASVKEACAAAVVFETTNVALYDRLLAAGPLPDDVKRAFDHNRVASLDHHKPAFERCSGVATARVAGRGAGHGTRPGAARGAGGGGGGQGCGPCGHGCGHCGPGSGHGCGHGCGQGQGGHGCGHRGPGHGES